MNADNKFLDFQEGNRHTVGWKGKLNDGPRYMAIFQFEPDVKDMAICQCSQITLFLRDKIGRWAATYNESSIMLIEVDGTVNFAGRTMIAREFVARRHGNKAIVQIPLNAPQDWTIAQEATVTDPPLQLDGMRLRQISDLANRLLRDFLGIQQRENGGRRKGSRSEVTIGEYKRIINQRMKYRTDNEYLQRHPEVKLSKLKRATRWALEKRDPPWIK